MTEESMLKFLQIVNADFVPHLSQKVDLAEFVHKAYCVAHCEVEETTFIKGLVVGYANDKDKKLSYISLVAVHPNCRQNGIARKLVTNFINYAKTIPYINAVGIHTNNPIALELYKSIGFKIIEKVDNRYYLEYKDL